MSVITSALAAAPGAFPATESHADDFDRLCAFARAHALGLFPIPPGRKSPTGIVNSFVGNFSKEQATWGRWREENPNCNFGVVCGPSDLIVVDVDIKNGVVQWVAFADWWRNNVNSELPEPTVRTPSGGLHIYFRSPDTDRGELRQPQLCPGVDVRAGNGYVVSPFSHTKKDGDAAVKADGQYVLLRNNIDAAPEALLRHCKGVSKKSPIVSRDLALAADGYPKDAAERAFVQPIVNGALEALRKSLVGNRNHSLFRAAVTIGTHVADGAIGKQLAEDLLTETSVEIGLEELEIARTIESGFKHGAQNGAALAGNPNIAFEGVRRITPPSAIGAFSTNGDDAFRLIWHGDNDDAPLKEWLVEKMLPKSGRALIAGQWGSYKTFVAFDLAGSVITKTPFAGRNVNYQGGVLWLAAEGQDEVRLRLAGLVNARLKATVEIGTGSPIDPDQLPFAWAERSPELSSHRARDQLRKIVAEADAAMMERHGVRLALLIIDTMMAAGGFKDANDAAEAQRVMKALGDIVVEFGILVVAVDHFGKDQAAGTRNSSVKEDNVDAVLALLVDRATGGEVKNPRMMLRKCRGASAGAEIPFTPRKVAVWEKSPNGMQSSDTLVIEWGSEKAPQSAKSAAGTRLSRSLRYFLEAVRVASRNLTPIIGEGGTLHVSEAAVRQEFYRQYEAKTNNAKAERYRKCVKEAVARQLIEPRTVDGVACFLAPLEPYSRTAP